jgi:hypothetical protein
MLLSHSMPLRTAMDHRQGCKWARRRGIHRLWSLTVAITNLATHAGPAASSTNETRGQVAAAAATAVCSPGSSTSCKNSGRIPDANNRTTAGCVQPLFCLEAISRPESNLTKRSHSCASVCCLASFRPTWLASAISLHRALPPPIPFLRQSQLATLCTRAGCEVRLLSLVDSIAVIQKH